MNDHKFSARGGHKDSIANEITLQLRELKRQINIELTHDLNVLRDQIMADIMHNVTNEIDRKIKHAVEKSLSEVRSDISNMNSQLVVTNERDAALIKQTTKELITKVSKHVCDEVYGRVVGEINTTIVPKVDNMVKWVNYNMQDGGEIIDKYRRTVENQNETLSITDGSRDSRIISPYVRMFFGED